MILSNEIKDIIKNRQNPHFSSSICSTCSAGCCSFTGFAIFENTIKIYEKYKQGNLIRNDYVFIPNLNYKNFVNKYFDIVVYNDLELYTFYPKIITNDDNLLSIPPFGSYYNNRDYIMKNNPWIINYGCIFQDKKRYIRGKDIKCILHTDAFENEITEKPIDCVFLTCQSNQTVIRPTESETRIWFDTLSKNYPDSMNKYEKCNINFS